jgi:hypothetical protein
MSEPGSRREWGTEAAKKRGCRRLGALVCGQNIPRTTLWQCEPWQLRESSRVERSGRCTAREAPVAAPSPAQQ